MLTLLKEEQPFYYHGNPIMRFDDLAKFVQFDPQDIPRERLVNGDAFDQTLETEISKIRERNKACLGDTYINRKEQGLNPHLDNLILLQSIDEFLNVREEQKKREAE